MRNRTARMSLTGAAISLFVLTGCQNMDPLTRPYVWKPTHVNMHNIAAMAVNPADLVHGRGTLRHGSYEDAQAVGHLIQAKPVPLNGGTGSSGGGGGSSAGGGT
jgi:uncharacterized membrane protein YgcG